MRRAIVSICMLVCSAMLFVGNAQTENPRGVYKLMTLEGKQGEIISPYEQYKICSDSATLTFRLEKNCFSITKQDDVFNYTGDQPQSAGDKHTLIYNSNAKHFSEKWWSNYKDHLYFPEDDWCTEHYESGRYAGEAEPILKLLTTTVVKEKSNPFSGAWRMIGMKDDLKVAKKQIPSLINDFETHTSEAKLFMVVTSSKALLIACADDAMGIMTEFSHDGKDTFVREKNAAKVKWLKRNIIAIENKKDNRTGYEIWQQVNFSEPIIGKITSILLHR